MDKGRWLFSAVSDWSGASSFFSVGTMPQQITRPRPNMAQHAPTNNPTMAQHGPTNNPALAKHDPTSPTN